jgi:hypothetical protein
MCKVHVQPPIRPSMAKGEAREVVYRLQDRPDRTPTQLPLILSRAAAGVTVETSVAHLDDGGHVWRILHVTGSAAEVAAARAAFEAYRPPHLVEKEVLGATPRRLILWYKYSADVAGKASHTALAFRLLGRDTAVTDRTRNGVLAIRILARAGPALQEFLRTVRRQSADMGFRLLYSGPVRDIATTRLTPPEEETLRTAHALGYYDVPRAIGVRDVAKAAGLSASAAGYRLRRAEAKLVGAFLEG